MNGPDNHLLEEKIGQLSTESGVYLFKDHNAKIIYVGKAKSLRSRVRSYFRATDQLSLKTQILVQQIQDLDTIITSNEVEALLCERSMIKHHRPKFNILLRDDKEFPSLRIDFRENWPRIEKVRRRKNDGATYLGPFTSGLQLRQVLDLVYRVFPLIRCSRHVFETTKRPCNYYHMKMCLAPCTLPVERDSYVAMIRGAVDLIEGRNRKAVQDLKEQMQAAANRQEYEAAARCRDQLAALEGIRQKQNVVLASDVIADAVGILVHDQAIALTVLHLRDGTIAGQDSFMLHAPLESRTELLASILMQYYEHRTPPEEILLPELPEGEVELAAALAASHNLPRPPKLRVPQRGDWSHLVDLAQRSASQHYDEHNASRDRLRTELELVRERLQLPRRPQRMECIDISNLQGTNIVAANVCFIDAKPAKHCYRIYAITTVTDKPDDFASIAEVVARRCRRAVEEDDAPNLLIIDGGAGQLAAARAAMAPWLNHPAIAEMSVVSLAKSRSESLAIDDLRQPLQSMERVFTDPKLAPLPLRPGSPEYRLLTRIRDEAHRFAISHHRHRRAKRAQTSLLESIRGIGPTLRSRLLQQFGGLNALRQASLDELRKVKGMKDDVAVALHSLLQAAEESE